MSHNDAGTDTNRRGRVLRIGAAAVAAAVTGAVALVALPGDDADAAQSGYVVTVGTRDLRKVVEATGTLQRATTATISYAGDTAASSTSGRSTADSTVAGSTNAATQVQGVSASAVRTVDVDPSPSSTATAEPTPSVESSPTASPTSSPDPTPTPEPSPTVEPSPTPSPRTPTIPTAPASPTTPSTPSVNTGSGDAQATTPAVVLTSVVAVGTRIERGAEVYTANTQPVVALIGDVPAWRSLAEGDDGADVRQLKENLVALGFGDNLTVDEDFTQDTADAVEMWEESLGRSDPDGSVDLGDVAVLSGGGDVIASLADVGDSLQPGMPIVTVGSQSQTLLVDVAVEDITTWPSGARTEVAWVDGTTNAGTVTVVGRDVVDGAIEIEIALEAATDRVNGSPATARVAAAVRTQVLAVPVSAIVSADAGGTAVRVASDDGDRRVPVEIGLVDGGWVEIRAGLDGGEDVRIPG